MITKGEIRRLEGSSDWTSELRVYRADDRLVRLQQVEAMYYEDGDDDYYYDGGSQDYSDDDGQDYYDDDGGEDDDHEQDLAMC